MSGGYKIVSFLSLLDHVPASRLVSELRKDAVVVVDVGPTSQARRSCGQDSGLPCLQQ